jgi:hypothetical protein
LEFPGNRQPDSSCGENCAGRDPNKKGRSMLRPYKDEIGIVG